MQVSNGANYDLRFHLLYCLFPTLKVFYSHISFLVPVPSPVCTSGSARRLHRHDDVIQTISPYLEENNVVGLNEKAPDPWQTSRPDIRVLHRFSSLQFRCQTRHTFSLFCDRELLSTDTQSLSKMTTVILSQITSSFLEVFGLSAIGYCCRCSLGCHSGLPTGGGPW